MGIPENIDALLVKFDMTPEVVSVKCHIVSHSAP